MEGATEVPGVCMWGGGGGPPVGERVRASARSSALQLLGDKAAEERQADRSVGA